MFGHIGDGSPDDGSDDLWVHVGAEVIFDHVFLKNLVHLGLPILDAADEATLRKPTR
jgi:hypothetical protein